MILVVFHYHYFIIFAENPVLEEYFCLNSEKVTNNFLVMGDNVYLRIKKVCVVAVGARVYLRIIRAKRNWLL